MMFPRHKGGDALLLTSVPFSFQQPPLEYLQEEITRMTDAISCTPSGQHNKY